MAENKEAKEDWDEDYYGVGPLLGDLTELRSVLEKERVDEIIVCLQLDSRFGDVAQIVQSAKDLGVVVRVVPDFEDGDLLGQVHIEEFDGQHIFTLFREKMLVQLLLKRIVDVTLSTAAAHSTRSADGGGCYSGESD